jgi:xanthine/uracil permease
MPLAIAMFYMAYWSSTAMRDPRSITVSRLNRFFYLSLAIFGFMLFLGIVWAVYAIMEEYDDWWFDVAFYGGVVGGALAAVIFNMAKEQAQALGYPQ